MVSNLYRAANFLTSAALYSQIPSDTGYEIAFVGRSNAGKSSAINALCGQTNLCRTSKIPGRTQLLNFFQLDAERRLVDLPGYGYAKAPGAEQQRWQRSIAEYLNQRNCLRGLILLMDIRTPLTEYDWNLITWCSERNLSVHVLLTKADKLKRGPSLNQLYLVQKQLQNYPLVVGIQTFSALKHQGLEQAYAVMDTWLDLCIS